MTRVISSTLALARPKVPSYHRVSKSAKNKGFGHCFLTFFLASLRARLSLLLRSNSMMRRSYGARLSDTIVRSPCPIQLHAMLLEQKNAGQRARAQRNNIPSDLLDELPDEGSPLAEVALGAAHPGLVDAGGRLL